MTASHFKIISVFLAVAIRATAQTYTPTDSIYETDSVKTTMLNEVVVIANESSGITSSSVIRRSAMEHLQPTSFTDLLELIPGNISHTPDMSKTNSITLRETGNLTASGSKSDNEDYAITSLGTLFLVDGAPINTDANMRGIPFYSTGNPESARETTNRGVDMRTIPTDNIESVEIIRGIPSAEYGNLTSGLVNIKRIRKPTPVTARFKADGFSKLFSVAKGFVAKKNILINIDGGYLDSKADPRNNLENYKRLTFSTRFNIRHSDSLSETYITFGADYTGSFDNTKIDPDLNYNKVDEYKSRFNRMSFTTTLKWQPFYIAWLSEIKLNASVSYQIDRIERRKQVAPQRAAVAPTSMEEGIHDGSYLLSEYIAEFISEGKPLNSFLKLTGNGKLNIGTSLHAYKLGIDLTISKNFGRGQIYDISRPLSASWSTRPRDYNSIPALHTLSVFAQDAITLTFGRNLAEIQAGIRLAMLPRLDSKYHLAGKVYADPRINAVWKFPSFTASGKPMRFQVAAGFGYTTKMPTIDYLYPQLSYKDFISLNYYDVNYPDQRSRIVLRTYINNPVNYDLKAARNMKWELRTGASWGEAMFSITFFNERMRSGFRYSTEYRPYEYIKYDAGDIDPSKLSEKPDITTLPSKTMTVLDGTRRVTNGSRLDKDGIEFQLTTPRWHVLRTALTMTGAWFRSTYSNSQLIYAAVNDVIDNRPVRETYIGLYDTDDGRRNQQFNTNFMFDTQIGRWGLIFTTTLQCMWFMSTERMKQNGIPACYISAEDGMLHPFSEKDLNDPMLRYLVKQYNDEAFRRQTIPPAVYLNLKATKRIGRWLNISAFVNNIINYLPDFKSNGLLIRRVADTYFGAEINLTI